MEKENKIQKIGNLVENLLHQIDITDFKDENGHDLKMNSAYIKLKNAVEEKSNEAYYCT